MPGDAGMVGYCDKGLGATDEVPEASFRVEWPLLRTCNHSTNTEEDMYIYIYIYIYIKFTIFLFYKVHKI